MTNGPGQLRKGLDRRGPATSAASQLKPPRAMITWIAAGTRSSLQPHTSIPAIGGWVEGPVPFRVRAGRLRRKSTDGRRSGREAAAGAALEQVRAASAQLEPAIADRCRADRGRVVVGCGKSCQDCRRLTGIDAKDEATGCLGVSHQQLVGLVVRARSRSVLPHARFRRPPPGMIPS